ncbi:MAG: Glutathione-regulated potassium-efflux system protein KefC [Phycisphaerales bacterium]|nr:Glutathione-regulated potassium-efflux system protein KefC [Phycisphaerales bacterium]
MIADTVITIASTPQSNARLFVDLLAILATAVFVATLFKRVRLESIPGYLVAGALVGPHALKLVSNAESIAQISELAIILLMFTIGLMLESDALKRGMVSMLAVGVVSTALVVLASWPIAMALGLDAPQGLVASLAFSMSSTAVLLRLLQQRRELRHPHGQLCVGVSIAQDVLSVAFLAALPLLAVWQSGGTDPAQAASRMHPAALWGLRLVAVACILVAGRIVLPTILHAVAGSARDRGATASSELVLIASAALAIGAALALGSLGFSPEMGAFLGGFMLSFTPYRHQLAGQLAPMKDLLMAVFFTVVGLRLDPGILAANWAHILFGVAVVLFAKTTLIGATAWALGASGPVALLAGAYLANAGEFTLVIVATAAGAGVFDARDVATAIAIVVVSLVLSPMLLGPIHALAARASSIPLAPWIRASGMRHHAARAAATEDTPSEAGAHAAEHSHRHVIIAGFGPVGRSLADRLVKRGIPFTVIEMNPRTVEKQTTLGKSIVYGDVTNVEVLESAGIRRADALVITVPDELATMRATQVARSLAPGLFIATRTNYLSQAIKARQFGADSVIVEEIVTAEAMANLVTELLEARKSAPFG